MRKTIIAATAILTMGTAFANAAEFEVKMLNKGAEGMMVFEPAFVKAEPGDTIRFVPTDKGHNVEAVESMLPEGVETFKSKFNKEYVLELKEDGIYGIVCTPHYGMGMVALIAAGDPVNLEEARAVEHKGKKAKERFAKAFEQLDAAYADQAPATN